MSEPLSKEEIDWMRKQAAIWNIYEVLDSHELLRQQLVQVTQERDQYKKDALVKFDCQVCSGALDAENESLRQQLATARQAVINELTQWAASQSVAIGHRFINCDEISAYRLALEHLQTKLKEMTP